MEKALMNKMIFASAAVATLAVGATGFAQENWSDKGGGFGLGVEQTYGGLDGTGISGRYFINNDFGINFMLGADYNSFSAGDNSGSTMRFDFGIGAEYRILKSQRANLNAYGAIGLNYYSVDLEDFGPGAGADDALGKCSVDEDSCLDLAFGLGLRGEVWLTNFFSLHGKVGINIDYDGEGVVGEEASRLQLSVFRGDLLGSFGFTFWFK